MRLLVAELDYSPMVSLINTTTNASAATESRGVGKQGGDAARWRVTFVGTWDIVGLVPPKFE